MSTLDSSTISTLLTSNPAAAQLLLSQVDAEIAKWTELKAQLVPGTAPVKHRGRRSKAELEAAGIAPRESPKHAEKILDILKGKKDGLQLSEIREAAVKMGHDFGNSLSTYISNMKKEKILVGKPVEPGSRNLKYSIKTTAAAK